MISLANLAQTESDSTSFWDRLWPVFLGAVFAFLFSLTIALLVQLIVVPRVEARKRREERWERDVLTLGELLSAEVPGLALVARRDMHFMQRFHQVLHKRDDIDPELRDNKLREEVETARQSIASYEAAAVTRAEWLANRIVSLDPSAVPLMTLNLHWMGFRLSVMALFRWHWANDDFTEEEFDRYWKDQDESLKKLQAVVMQLADLPHPPRQPGPMSRWSRRALTWLGGRLVAAWRRVRSRLLHREPTSGGE